MSDLVEQLQNDNLMLLETVRDLELSLESVDWRRIVQNSREEFTREGIRRITELARIFYMKNPLIRRGVSVQKLYVWGQGWSVQAKDDEIQAVVSDFLDDPKNKAELTSQMALGQKEVEQQTDANTFFVFFHSKVTGKVRVRTVPFEEIMDIVCSPDDAKEPWLYERSWSTDPSIDRVTEQKQAYYPDWQYNPTQKPETVNGLPVMWDSPIFHIKTGAFSNWKFGVSEVYSPLDWARAYKEYLEDFASITRAHRRFAWDMKVPGGKASIAAAKARLGTTVGSSASGSSGHDTNPPPLTGSTFIGSGDTSMAPLRTAGATASLDEGRRFSLMAFAGMGLPETFFGDVSVGTLATATSLDRPTELMVLDRQTMWKDAFGQIFQYVLKRDIEAPRGRLRQMATIRRDKIGEQVEEYIEWADSVESRIDIDFPPILNRSLLEEIQAIVTAGTLDNKSLSGTIDIVTLSRMLLSALGEDDIDEIMAQNFPDGEIPDWALPENIMSRDVQTSQAPEAKQVVEALRERLLRVWSAIE